MKRITYKLKSNGKYVYNFLDGDINYNNEFRMFGRVTKTGIHSNCTPEQVSHVLIHDWLANHDNIPVYIALGIYQKQIDKCNGYKGCVSHCNTLQRKNCYKIAHHNSLVEKLGAINEFRFLEFEEVK